MTETDKTLYMRNYMAKRRGTKRSYKTEADAACVLLAWEAAEITEGQAAKLLRMDRVDVRGLRLKMLEQCKAMLQEATP